MSTNYVAQNSPQLWTWEPAMDFQHHHFQVQQQQQQQGEQRSITGREHMFEKPLTPSDVGKLNRLVIPKQHAEKHFPLDNESGEKGLLLSFEDDTGKSWRFRYSYWSSSQSYVLTKGWSRFVKEKRLEAGDIVFFQRRRADHLLYVGCRRRGSSYTPDYASQSTAAPNALLLWNASPNASTSPPASCFYINPVHLHEESHTESMRESAMEAAAKTPGNSRRLRLFGVNLDCGPEQ